ncbi:hypothetical protein [Massilia brevitalea]|uniref:hypothetical protein n=1 Tax=Massilia brevitalea TaxID=442526 RepID=UPI002738FDF6|nr:hypothetical protein [Massilia brevitalea]
MTVDGMVNIGPALVSSHVTRLFGRPYPIQFREQGAIEAWTGTLENTGLWRCWQSPATPCWEIRREVLRQLECMASSSTIFGQLDAEERLRLAFAVSMNLKYHLGQGTVIEGTPALETLLMNSDVDLGLPMSMVAPPYRAQYLRFGETATQYLKVPNPQSPDHVFDGVFCFLTRYPLLNEPGEYCWTLELIFITKRAGCYGGHVALLGETDRGHVTVGEWLDRVLASFTGETGSELHRSTHAAVSYVVRIFLYMALKQPRMLPHRDYDEAIRRAAGLGERKRAKLLQRAAGRYNGIIVGPEALPSAAAAGKTVCGVAPHWRRGHFRMQACGAGNAQRKLIFVAPTLIHADQLQGKVPEPKSYRAGPLQ